MKLPDGRPAVGANVGPAGAAERERVGIYLPDDLIEKISGVADAEGRVRLPALSSLELSDLAVTLDPFGRQLFHSDMDDDGAEPTLELRPVGRIEGRLVTDQLDLVRGLWITVSSYSLASRDDREQAQGRAAVQVDGEGRFVVDQIASGSLIMQAAWDMQLPIRPRMPDGRDAALLPGETVRVDIPLEACTRVHGVVRIETTGRPVAGAKVWVGDVNFQEGSQVITDQQGAYSTYVLPAEPIITLVEYAPIGVPKPDQRDHQFRVPRGRKEFEFKPIELSPTVTVRGTLLGTDGKPLNGLAVRLWIDERVLNPSPPTDDKGVFSLEVPADAKPGRYLVSFGNYSIEATKKSLDPLVLEVETEKPPTGKQP